MNFDGNTNMYMPVVPAYGGGYSEGGYGARGRGRNARRNSMGRYAAGDDEYIQELEKLLDMTKNEKARQSIQKALDEAQMM